MPRASRLLRTGRYGQQGLFLSGSTPVWAGFAPALVGFAPALAGFALALAGFGRHIRGFDVFSG